MKIPLLLTLLTASARVFATQPNIVFIYADDMGWTGTSVEMIQGDSNTRSDFHQTPQLEKLAATGLIFSQAYSPGPLCTPSRAGVLTGQNPAELHITTPGGGQADSSNQVSTPQTATRLPDDIPTLGTLLQAEGYATALLGKWHIGRSDHAGNHGFDLHDGSTANANHGTAEDPKEIFSLTERGIQFMEAQVKAGKPFYLQLSHYAVHSPTQARPASEERFKQLPSGEIHIDTDYAAMTWDLDASLAHLFQALERLKIVDHTYIVFMSDNGAAGNRRKPNNTPLFAGKGTLYEGGIRIPLIISGPGIHSGYCPEPVSGTDLFATFAAWAGAEIESTESEDLTPLLTGKEADFKRDLDLLFHYPHYGIGPIHKPQTALISKPWKLLKDWETDSYQLFDLSKDIGESTDRSTQEPDRFKEMVRLMNQRLTAIGAQLPEENPDYDPSTQQNQRSRRNR
ncbi:MAG: sulfatase [Pontiella sp.]